MERIIISGGGTGGHIFPAVAIADEVRRRYPSARILFVGAEGKMEMEKVPQAGYPIVGLPIRGLQRALTAKNLAVPFRLLASLRMARQLLAKERPQVVVGVGGYASGPLLLAARWAGIPYIIQEQNSYAGVTNRFLARRAKVVCTAYPGMEAQLKGATIQLTGNPVRAGYEPERLASLRAEALEHFGLVDNLPVLLVTGGSLGARTLNQAVDAGIEKLAGAGYQLLWQTGKAYAPRAAERVEAGQKMWTTSEPGGKLWTSAFITRMDLAYAAADVVVARAGALTISELCLAGKPSILVPSPNVAEDHQTHNARALADRGAALLIPDAVAVQELIPEAISLLENEAMRRDFSQKVATLGHPNAAARIVDVLERLVA
jgi:UDP-N-acetylglucosamine--N-acetylmuramyl-(pentapeptide) pyrophosphoryl-undecaprenol N-acetylglucosamine transferase